MNEDETPEGLIARFFRAFDILNSDRGGLEIEWARNAFVFRQPHPQYYGRLTMKALVKTLEKRAGVQHAKD